MKKYLEVFEISSALCPKMSFGEKQLQSFGNVALAIGLGIILKAITFILMGISRKQLY